MKQSFLLFIAVSLTLLICKKDSAISSQDTPRLIDSDSSIIAQKKTNHNPNGFETPKSLVDQQNQEQNNHSIKFFERDAINNFIFIGDLFQAKEMDPIEFYGTFDPQKLAVNYFPDNALFVIYFNHKGLLEIG
ncbi:MAG: hypothetical protein ACJAX3_000596 [Patiriisocius sp.]|jgi:hypothetical protein